MEQFDITEFAKMFDAALASDNPAVKKALRNFMMVAAIVHAQEEDEQVKGPLETLLSEVANLKRMLYELQNNRAGYSGTTDYQKDYYYGNYRNPTWVYKPGSTSTTSTVSTTSSSGETLKSITGLEIADILKDLKFK